MSGSQFLFEPWLGRSRDMTRRECSDARIGAMLAKFFELPSKPCNKSMGGFVDVSSP